MNKLIAAFTQQLSEALVIGKRTACPTDGFVPKQVVISGMGGSGIGGTIIQNFAAGRVNIPVIVNKSYILPAFVNEDSLVLISSYSGNTEETIAAMQVAIAKGCRVVCIASGGEIARLAAAKGFTCFLVPAGMQPRACLGYSLVQLLYVFAYYGLIDFGFEQDVAAAIVLLEEQESAMQREAHELADWMKGKTPVIYIGEMMQGIAIRWCQQINENGKSLCWHNVVPEMNHNEIEGWSQQRTDIVALFIRNPDDHERIRLRMDINESLIGPKSAGLRSVYTLGDRYLVQAIYLIHLGDWVSWYLSQANEVNPNEVKMIDFLKQALIQ